MGQFGVSQPVVRREDVRLLTGQGRFIDDQTPSNVAHGCVLRSPHGHARITHIDAAEARQAPGVLAVYTGAEPAADGIGEIACLAAPKTKQDTAFIEHRQPLLVKEYARFVGDYIAFVVAETREQARDALELITVDYETLPVITACDAAAQPGAPRVWDDADQNVCFVWETGDGAATETAFASAAHVVALDVVNNRVVLNAIETRGSLGVYDSETDKLTLYTGSQMPNSIRDQLAKDIFAVAPEKVRVVVRDVGGGFGGKNSLYPEQALVLYAARKLGRPVKWMGERSDAFISDFHGRDNVTHGKLALDSDGRFLAIRVSTYANLGAYTASRGPVSPINGVVMMSNVYRIPSLYVEVKGVYTHTVPTDPYRGAGRPEVTYLVERLVDTAAQELGIDRIELRRRNYIPPEAFPYTTPTGLTYDPCDFEKMLDEALERSQWDGIETRRAEALSRGRLRGIGLANYIERCGGGAGLSEAALLRFEPDGSVALLIGSMANGQGHETAYSQLITERLGLPFEKIQVVQGDTDRVTTGLGTGGSWSIPMGGGAVYLAADKIIEKARRIASYLLETAEADIEFVDGRFAVAGTDLEITLEDVAKAAFKPEMLPADSEPGLAGEARFTPENFTYPYGCHVCEVEVDPDTGAVEIINYSAVHDFGRALNPLLLAGQVHGGVAQGIGQALLEHTVYDADGQLLSGSLMDYCLPRADDLPEFDYLRRETPTPSNPLGVKGCGEAGATGSPPAVINAIVDALAPYGVRHLDMPATPERIWSILGHAVRAE